MQKQINFRASAMGALMTGCKPNTPQHRLTELQFKDFEKLVEIDRELLSTAQEKKLNGLIQKINNPNELSDTAKTMIFEAWLKFRKDFDEYFENKYIKKGKLAEDDSINLLSAVRSVPYFKNTKRETIGNITGEADILTSDTVIDVKSSWSPLTFMKSDMTSMYEWQLRTYMYLYDKPLGELAYCLVDCPAEVFADIERQQHWQRGVIDPESDFAMEITSQLQKNMVYSTNPKYTQLERVKTFLIERDEMLEKMMLEQVERALEFAESLTLNFKH